MPFKISYWTASRSNNNIAGGGISSESLAISGTSAKSGATPANAVYVKISATEAGYFRYDSTDPTAITGTDYYLASGETMWLDAIPTYKVAGIT